MTELKTREVSAHIATAETENMYLNFNVGSRVYGIEIRYVLKIIGMREIIEMPDMPPGMMGFINLRGNAIPVVSMRRRFGKAEDTYTGQASIIVLRVSESTIGLIVDSIGKATTIDPNDISPLPEIKKSVTNPYVHVLQSYARKVA